MNVPAVPITTANQPARNTRAAASMIEPAQRAKPTKANIGKKESIAKEAQKSCDDMQQGSQHDQDESPECDFRRRGGSGIAVGLTVVRGYSEEALLSASEAGWISLLSSLSCKDIVNPCRSCVILAVCEAHRSTVLTLPSSLQPDLSLCLGLHKAAVRMLVRPS